MKNFILAYPTCVKFEHILKCKKLANEISPEAKLVKFDYHSDHYNPINADVGGVILFADGRMVSDGAMRRVVDVCDKHNVPLYIPCVHDLFPRETFSWTVKRGKNFRKGVTTLEKMNIEDMKGIMNTGIIPCMTLPM